MRLEHFSKHEHAFVIQVEDWMNQVYSNHHLKLTKFLTPREQQILQMIVNQNEELLVQFQGGFINAERQRAIIMPIWGTELSYPVIKGYKLEYNRRFATIEHRQVLGALTSLNIERALIGDILVQESGDIYLCICEEFSSFLEQNLFKVGRHSVELTPTDIEGLEKVENYVEEEVIVSSMRLDVIVASLTNASRSQVSESIKQGNVQLNFKMEQNHSALCQVGDMLSIKRFGRYQLIAQKSMTKSGRIVLIVGKIV